MSGLNIGVDDESFDFVYTGNIVFGLLLVKVSILVPNPPVVITAVFIKLKNFLQLKIIPYIILILVRQNYIFTPFFKFLLFNKIM